MYQSDKDHLLAEARAHIAEVTDTIGGVVERLERSAQAAAEAVRQIDVRESETAFEDQLRAQAAMTGVSVMREQMEQLAQSPYFARLDVAFEDEPERSYYIAKYSASELGIYSWTAPVAALRFEVPGRASYRLPSGEERTGQMSRRDQYMIARGHLNFMTTELTGTERELIYQEHFSARKSGFVLPEVVAQMEKAQDQVIRADHRGPFVIAGPAGSGKTTLALHRVAYLRQAPETAALYPAESILVLVQDEGTEDYFSHLLPELGIHDVQITTFGHWAIGQLGLRRYFYHARAGHNELERDRYEWAKIRAVKAWAVSVAGMAELRRPDQVLLAHYREYLDEGQLGLLRGELEEGALDRFDLTLLLLWTVRAGGGLTRVVEDVTWLKNGKTRTALRPAPLEYSLVLVDEFQNYLPEQLEILKGVTNGLKSMLYIGDMAQQTQFGTMRQWAEIDEVIAPERAIKLEKVYRNTRQILEYIRGLGYEVEVPAGVQDGPAVAEHEAADVVETLQYIVGLSRAPGTLLGIIAKDPETIETYREYFKDDASVHCLTMREAQGVEFDVVCLVGLDAGTFAVDVADAELAVAQRRVNRDLLYMALTRAMSELHVIFGFEGRWPVSFIK